MPEGDTIYRSARALQKALGGKVVTAFDTGLARLASVNDDKPLVGRVVEKVEARGKWCLIYFSGDLILVTHMLMSGTWHIYRTGEKWWMGRSRMRVAITVGPTDSPQGLKPPFSEISDLAGLKPSPFNDEGGGPGWNAVAAAEERRFASGTTNKKEDGGGFVAVAFNVPIAEFHTARSLERSTQVPKLGVDVLGDEFSVDAGVKALRERAASHPDDEIAVVLLNQRVMAGLGNVYKSEVPFAAGVNPFRQMRTITQREMEVMAEVSQRYMKANVMDGAADGIVTYTGNRRTTHSMNAGDRLWVYGRQGQECRRCGANVMMRKQGEQVRSTYWCPGCQPWVAGEGQQAEVAPVGRQVKLLGTRRRGSC